MIEIPASQKNQFTIAKRPAVHIEHPAEETQLVIHNNTETATVRVHFDKNKITITVKDERFQL